MDFVIIGNGVAGMNAAISIRSRDKTSPITIRMIVKIQGRIGVYACTLVDDDPDYDLGATLIESLNVRVALKHHRCYSCFAQGATCSEM